MRLPNDFTPRPYQRKYMRYFDNGGKRAVWVVHRRGGKDLTALHQTCKMAHERVGAYWHVFPTAEQGRKAIWEGFTKEGKRIMEQVFPAEIRKSPKEFLPKAEMVVELKCGSIWRLLGSDKIEVVGAGPVGVVFSEYSVAKPSAWNLIRPMLRENEGWASFIFTPRGRNHGKKLFDVAQRTPGWFWDLKTLRDTRAYDPEKTMEEERAEGMPEDLIKQEYLCDWEAAVVGSIWADLIGKTEKAGRAGIEFEHPRDGVFCSYDLGFTDATAIWFWRLNANGGLDFIDHYESHGQPLSHYFDVVEKRFPDRREKVFDAQGRDTGREIEICGVVKHWLPHDAAAHTLATGSSVEDQFRTRFRGAVAIGPSLSLLDGIQAARWLLEQPCRFHARCGEGVEALRSYHYEWDDDTKTYSRKPEHDWSSHTADAFRYAALVAKHVMRISAKPPPPAPVVIPPLHKTFTLERLFADNEASKGRERV